MSGMKRGDAVLVLAVLTVSLCLLLTRYTPASSLTARVYENGSLTHTVDLSGEEENKKIKINGGVLEIKDGAIRYCDCDCPDKLCEKFGWLASNGATASCVPNKTVVTVTADKNDNSLDIMTY